MAENEGTKGAPAHQLLRQAQLPVEGFSPELRKQIDRLSSEEVRALISIKSKLNTGLSEQLKQAADTVGGFVW